MNKKYLLIALLIFIFLFIFLVFLAWRFLAFNQGSEYRVEARPTIIPAPTPTPDPLAPYSVLLLGYPGADYDGSSLTDTIIFSYIQPKKKQAVLISIPRDLWVNLAISKEENKHFKINIAYAIGNDEKYLEKEQKYTGKSGGLNMAKDVLGQVVGIPVDYVISANYAGFTNTIDILGGIDVYVPLTFKDPYFPIKDKEDDLCGMTEEDIATISATISGHLLEREFKCRFEELEFKVGLQNMDGATALKFARSRHSETYGGDFSRSERQRALVKAIKEKVFHISTIPKIFALTSTIYKNVSTDVDLALIKKVLTTHPNLDEYEINSIALTNKNVFKEAVSGEGQYILIPKEGINSFEGVHQFIKTELDFLEKKATVSGNLK